MTGTPNISDVQPRFVQGSLLGHVIVMAGTGAIGLIAVFAVDLLNLFYISRLGQRPIAAALGFAGVVNFFQISLCIGMTIGVAAVVSRAYGAGHLADARRIAAASLAVMVPVAAVIGIATVILIDPLLDLLGAMGAVRATAAGYLAIVSPSLPLMAAGMCLAALLRSIGDARRALNVTLVGAITTAALDPLLIFGLHLDLDGAAISTVVSRAAMLYLGYLGGVRRHSLVGRLDWSRLGADLAAVSAVAGPAILTNLATPAAAAYVTRSMAAFGPAAVAGQASVDRISPVAFGLVYALTGAVGPILSQNLGAGLIDRVREGLRDSLLFVLGSVCVAWAVLFVAQDAIVNVLDAGGETAALIRLFCTFVAGSFLFTGALFVANAAFNNLGFPLLSTLFNWGRAIVGTIPLVMLARHWGPGGVMIAAASGSVVFGSVAVVVAFRVIQGLDPAALHVSHGDLPIPGGAGAAAFAPLTSASGRPRH